MLNHRFLKLIVLIFTNFAQNLMAYKICLIDFLNNNIFVTKKTLILFIRVNIYLI